MKKTLILTTVLTFVVFIVFTGNHLIEEPETDLSESGKTTQHDLVFKYSDNLRTGYWEVNGSLEPRHFGNIGNIKDAVSWTGDGTYYSNSYEIDPNAEPSSVRTPIGLVEVTGFNTDRTYKGSYLLRVGESLKRDLTLPKGDYSFVAKIKHANIITRDIECEESRVTVSNRMTSKELLITNHDDWKYQEIENFHAQDSTGDTHFMITNNLDDSENCRDSPVLAIKEIYLEKSLK